MDIVEVDIEALIPDPENARTHDDKNLAAIRGSIKQFDVVEPLVVQRRNNIVLGGNGRLEVMKAMGFKTAPVHYVDLDDKKAKALALALNRTAELADWNMERLREQLAEIDEPELIGFDDSFTPIEGEMEETTEVSNGPNDDEKLEKYLKREFLEIKLIYSKGNYENITMALDAYMEAKNLESYSEVIANLLGVSYAHHNAKEV